MNAHELERAGESETPRFASADNLALDQVRLENLWLREQLQALSRRNEERRERRRERLDTIKLAA